MKNLILAGLGSLVLAGAASAAPTGLGWTSTSVTKAGVKYWVGRLYIVCDNPNDTVLNVFNADIKLVGQGTFNHNDTTGSSWSPNAFIPQLNIGNPSVDSYVTIGGATGDAFTNANSTNFDPSFVATTTTAKGGWFNGNPPNLQGKVGNVAGIGLATCIGQFVLKADDNNVDGTNLMVTLKQTTNQGIGTPAYPQTEFSGMFELCPPIPAPGALALLGLAGLVGGRRRRA